MKKPIASVLFILLFSTLAAAEPKFGKSGGFSRSSPSHSYSSSRHSSPSHSAPSHSAPSHHAVSSPAISHSYPSHSGSSGISRPATNTHVSSGGSHSYPTSNNGMSGGNKPNTPFTGTAVGGHSSPTGPISSVSFKPSNSQPHIGNTGSHGYPASNGGLSGHATNVRPVQNQPFHGTPVGGQPAYPTSNGLSGNSRYPNTGNANTPHIQTNHNQPMYNQPNTGYGHVAPGYGQAYSGTAYHAVPVVPVTYGVHGPVYTTAPAGYHPTFVTHSTHSSGSDLNSMLTGLALYNVLRSGHSHDHYYHHHGYGHGNTQNTYNNYYSNTSDPNSRPVSPSQSNSNTASVPSTAGLTNCTLSLSNFNGTDTITIPCDIASSFAVQNTSAPLPAPTSETKLNCTIAVVKNNGLTEFTQIPCDMITNMAPKPEPPAMRLNCTQSQGPNYGNNPCSIIPSAAEIFPLEVIPLEIKADSPKGPEIISNPSITPNLPLIGSDKPAAAAAA